MTKENKKKCGIKRNYSDYMYRVWKIDTEKENKKKTIKRNIINQKVKKKNKRGKK